MIGEVSPDHEKYHADINNLGVVYFMSVHQYKQII